MPDVGEAVTGGRDGKDGPPLKGDWCLYDVETECNDEAEDSAPDLNGCTGGGRRIGSGEGDEGRSWKKLNTLMNPACLHAM